MAQELNLSLLLIVANEWLFILTGELVYLMLTDPLISHNFLLQVDAGEFHNNHGPHHGSACCGGSQREEIAVVLNHGHQNSEKLSGDDVGLKGIILDIGVNQELMENGTKPGPKQTKKLAHVSSKSNEGQGEETWCKTCR